MYEVSGRNHHVAALNLRRLALAMTLAPALALFSLLNLEFFSLPSLMKELIKDILCYDPLVDICFK